ncbi:uncharacterized protein LOC116179684 [Photinus pyralis]|uniref:THAP-type domain-containing protein n=1 Tax=Photinus pyralis TaxID=7054 RepID=A0A1Y1LTD1_PHOPY|nr:uncharacterized protein LOC116166481 isoform X2 [Photinus pyralis]XP_031355359.1 uncharacterized protein LOC116179684 [Photinus pyralis]
MVMCFVPDCKHYSEKHACRFFTFPKDANEKRRWIKLIRRDDRNPTSHSLVCGCHFKDGNRSNGPTIFERNKGKLFDVPEVEVRHRKKQQPRSASPAVAGPSWLPDPVPLEEHQPEEPAKEVIEESSTSAPTVLPEFSAMLEAQVYFLEKENKELKEALEKCAGKLSFAAIANTDHLISVYTGIPTKDIYLALYSLMENHELNYYYKWNVVTIPKIDQLLITLMKLRLNLLLDDLSVRFGVTKGTISNIVKTWMFALHEVLFKHFMAEVPTTSKNKCCLPSSFNSFTNCRMILDCTEMACIHPQNMEKQRATYSSYKHRNTLKGLIGVAPNGVITYASKLYPGSISDKKIVQDSGVLKVFQPGDLILADKGFLIADLLPQGVHINTPPFLCSAQFTPEQVIMTRTIARARIHVERAISRIKCFRILNMIPQTLIPHASIIFQLCAAITNLQFPLIKEVGEMYLE